MCEVKFSPRFKRSGKDSLVAVMCLLEQGAVCVIDSDRAVGRRRLALVHELGRYLLADEYTVDWRVGPGANAQRTESLIDEFARALLLPSESLKQRWAEMKSGGSVRNAAVRIASEYRVDMSTLAASLPDLNMGDSDELSQVRGRRYAGRAGNTKVRTGR